MQDISVIIPNFNKADYLNSTLFFLLDNKVKENVKEIIFIDDASTDNSVSIVEKLSNNSYLNIKIILNKKNKGPSFCRNVGIKNSSGKYLVFLDSDVFIKKRQFLTLIKDRNKYDLIFPRVKFRNKSIKCPIGKFEEKFCMDSAIFSIRRKTLIKAKINFDEIMDQAEDADFFLQLKKINTKNFYCEDVTCTHPDVTDLSLEIYYKRLKNIMYLGMKGFLNRTYVYKMPWIVYLFGNMGLYFLIAITKNNYSLKGKEQEVYKEASRLSLIKMYFKAIFDSFLMFFKKSN